MATLPTSVHINAVFLLGAMLAVIVSGSKRVSLSGQFQAMAVVLMLLGVAAAALTRCLDATCDFKDVGMYRFALDMFALSALLMAMRMLLTKTAPRSTWMLTGCLGIAFKVSELLLGHTCPIAV
jgi:hypothetical protein